MIVDVVFEESNDTFDTEFGEVFNISDGGYEKGYADGYEKGDTDGREIGKAEGYEQGVTDGYNKGYAEAKAEEETFFTINGTMYKKNMVIDSEGTSGFVGNVYQYADQLETVSAPYLRSGNNISASVFRFCSKLKSVYLPRIERVGNTYFGNCEALEEITLGCEEYPMLQINTNALQNCYALVRFNYVGVIERSFDVHTCTALSHDSLITILNSLSSSTAGTLTLGATNLAKLTDEEKAIATNKGWKLA